MLLHVDSPVQLYAPTLTAAGRKGQRALGVVSCCSALLLYNFLHVDFRIVKAGLCCKLKSLKSNAHFIKCSSALGLISGCRVSNWNDIT